MDLPHQIKTIDITNESVFIENKSKFIAQVYSADSDKEAKKILAKTKKKYFNASHHCYAFRFADKHVRYSDAGEPSGTAGIRILNAIEYFELFNSMVIVSRFFGGIKLGVGPLGKAYYFAAHKVLSESKILLKQLFQKVIILAPFDQLNIVHRILSYHKSIIINTDYEDSIKLSCLIKSSEIDEFFQKTKDMGKNNINLTATSEFLYK